MTDSGNIANDDDVDDGHTEQEDPLVFVVNALKMADGLLVNRSGRACISLPSTRGVVPLESRHALHWLAAEFCRITNRAPTRGQIQMLAMVLQGIAEELPTQESTDQELWDRIDGEPVIQAVMAYFEGDDKRNFRGTMTELRKQLTAVARERQIFYAVDWPPTANQLGRRLNELEPLLRAAGYVLRRHATNTMRIVHLFPLGNDGDDTHSSSSPSASPHNSEDPSLLGFSDDGDDPESIKAICKSIEQLRPVPRPTSPPEKENLDD